MIKPGLAAVLYPPKIIPLYSAGAAVMALIVMSCAQWASRSAMR
jgi:hypothetical protein